MTALNRFDSSTMEILYLAQHAPKTGDAELQPHPHPIHGMKPLYHNAIFEILKGLGFSVKSSSTLEDLLAIGRDFDYVFSLYNRAPFRACEVFVSTVCEFLHLPYLGGTPEIRAIAEDKHLAKVLARFLKIPTPQWKIYRMGESLFPPRFAGPYFSKPRFGAGSSFIDETSIHDSWDSAHCKLQELFAHCTDVILEKFVEGTNVNCAIIGGSPPLILPLVKSTSTLRGEVQTAAQKKLLEGGLNRSIFLDEQRSQEIINYSRRLYGHTQPLDYTRIDFRVPYDPAKKASMLELNVCPNLGSHSTIVFAGQHVGMSQVELVTSILDHSFRRQ